jgi:hypothetical protein
MTTIKTLLKDNFDTEVIIQGARAQNSNEDIASLIFQNYDNDTSNIYKIAEIAMRDNYGNSNPNGIGNLYFRTNADGGCNVTDRMVILHNGFVGINNNSPQELLHILGNASISSNIFTSNIYASNIIYKNEPSFYPITDTQITNTLYTKTFSWIYNASESNIRKIKNIGIRSYLHTTYNNSSNNSNNSNINYTLRIYDSSNNITLGSQTLSNIIPTVNYITLSNLSSNNTILELHAKKGEYGSYVNIDGLIVRYNL